MENLLPHVIKKIAQEIRQLALNPVEGVTMLTNDREISDIQAIVDGPIDTPFENGKFRIRIVLSNAYPQKAPTGYFITKIFHPNISPKNGEICVNTLKKDWTADTGIKKILMTIKCLLIYPNPESALNEEAGHLLLEDYMEYSKQARMFTSIYATQNSQSASSSLNFVTDPPQVLNCANVTSSTSILKNNSDCNDAGPVAKRITSNEHHSNSETSTKKKPIPQHKKALRRL